MVYATHIKNGYSEWSVRSAQVNYEEIQWIKDDGSILVI